MLKKIITFFQSDAFFELFRYGIIGILTTIVSYGTMYVFHYMCGIEANISNTISILCAILFAYLANKVFVFQSKTNTAKELLKEAVSFFAARGVSMLVEIILYFLLSTPLHIEPMISKLLVNIIVLILNYILSKLFVFKKGK